MRYTPLSPFWREAGGISSILERQVHMHNTSNHSRTLEGPQTAGRTLHWAGRYDFMTSMMGLGVNSSSSRMVVEMAGIKPGDKVLDVGCGSGNLTLTARKYAGEAGSVYGIDASPEMIATARKKAERAGSDTHFDVGLIEKIDHPDNTFDAVINRLMVHHLPDELKRQAFAEVLRALKPGGLFFIADFNRPANPILAHLSMVVVGHGMMQTDINILPPMLEQAGYTDVTSGKTRSAFLAFVSGRKPAA